MIDAPAVIAPWEQPQRLVRLPDGRRLNLYCTGTGAPAAILESGFAATTWSWAAVQPLIARDRRVCSYDRAGLGFSDAGPGPRDGAAVVADLRAALRAAKVAPPYVLVGHSAGALTMRMFAAAHRQDVRGLVLLDPSVEGQFDGQEAAVAARVAADEACADLAEKGRLPAENPRFARCFRIPPASVGARLRTLGMAAQRRPSYWRTLASEYAAIAGANSAALRAGPQSYGDLPLVVLTAGRTAAADPRWESWHRALAARSTRGRQATLADVSHNVMRDAPAAVAAAVAEAAR